MKRNPNGMQSEFMYCISDNSWMMMGKRQIANDTNCLYSFFHFPSRHLVQLLSSQTHGFYANNIVCDKWWVPLDGSYQFHFHSFVVFLCVSPRAPIIICIMIKCLLMKDMTHRPSHIIISLFHRIRIRSQREAEDRWSPLMPCTRP